MKEKTDVQQTESPFQKLRVVALTAGAIMEDRERVIAAGFDSYIAKPIDLVEVEAQVAVLASSRFASRPSLLE